MKKLERKDIGHLRGGVRGELSKDDMREGFAPGNVPYSSASSGSGGGGNPIDP